jgi:phosphate transport system permease protein
MNRQSLKIAALDSDSIRFANAQPESKIEWERWTLPPNATPLVAEWSVDGSILYVGTKEGELVVFGTDNELQPSAFGEPITALGFVLGHNSLLVGGANGKLAAYQVIRREGAARLQCFHAFKPLDGSAAGFMASLRAKRFLAWSNKGFSVNHLTTEKCLAHSEADIRGTAALSPRGDYILASGDNAARQWRLDAFHPEVSWSLFWRKIHYEGYTEPEYVWQSGGATDDIEPKFSLVPLLFGTIKGTFYAMLFAFPIAVLSALYASQFASPRLRGAIKPTVEIMAGLPSVVLGFIAGLVLAPLLENWLIAVLMVIPVAFVLAFLLMLAWLKLPKPFRDKFGNGQEALWLIPVIILSLAVSSWIAPAAENLFFGGDYRNWLYQGHGILYDQRNSIVVGFAMGFAVIPIIFSISEDAFTAVPKSLSSASLACGASPWQTAWRVVLPTASPGVFSAVMVGFGRAIGETMIVLMATGNTPLMDWGPFNGMRTLSANIAVEIPEAPHQGTLYRILFFTALLLFVLTFFLNTAAEMIRQSLRKRYESM